MIEFSWPFTQGEPFADVGSEWTGNAKSLSDHSAED